MIGIILRTERSRWNKNYEEEDGLFTGNLETGRALRSQQLYKLMREQSIVGGESTGNKGGRGYASNLTGPIQYIEPLNRQQTLSSN